MRACTDSPTQYLSLLVLVGPIRHAFIVVRDHLTLVEETLLVHLGVEANWRDALQLVL